MPKFRMPMSKSKDILPDSNSWWKYNFDIIVKGQCHKCTRHIVPWWYTHVPNKVWLCLVLNTQQCHKPYNFDLKVKVQGCIRIMNVLDTSSHGDRPICQIWYTNVKANRSYRSYMKTWQKPLNLTLRSKVNIESGSWMYATHCLMVIHPCAKYCKPMSIKKKIMGRTRKTCQKPYKFDLDDVYDFILK